MLLRLELPDDALLMRRVLQAGVLYPLVFFGALANLLVAAQLALGRWPRPSLDDPGLISWQVSALYLQQMLLLVAWPLAALGWLAACAWFARRRDWRRAGLGLALGLIAWTTFFAVPRYDPGAVFTWLMD
jgi:hypothetical protein